MSLRRRVMLFSLAVLGVVLVLVSGLVLLLTGIESRSDLLVQLNTRAALAEQLARQHVSPATIVERVKGPAVRVRLVAQDGTTYGSGGRQYPPGPGRGQPDGTGPPDPGPPGADPDDPDDPGPPDLGPPDPGAPGPAPPHPEAQGQPSHRGPVLRRTLSSGAQLTLFGDAGELTAIQRRLSRLLLMLGLGGLAVAGIALFVTTRLALGPLDTMTALARSIAAGDRGRRLAPIRTDTELGRTAAAFDDMLDALEGAERTAKQAEAVARDSERQTRQFVADAAHELRTPITGLRAAAEAALSSRATGEERERLHLLLLREAGRAGRLVEDLLALAQIDAGLRLLREPVELRALAEAEAERIRLLAPTVTVSVLGEPLTVPGDPQRLAQVLANLLDNARRYTPDGGEITITVDQSRDAAGSEASGGAPDGPATGGSVARVRVADTGPGVPEADRERIFDRLVRLDDARRRDAGGPGFSGAGLGLAIARGIAHAHGGELRCDDDSAFELTLPSS
ncbi:MAG TPA: ATP-binding protein [Pseudonocardia sp.]|nr:ATP-binding protein [Pseudonocardia sp.]